MKHVFLLLIITNRFPAPIAYTRWKESDAHGDAQQHNHTHNHTLYPTTGDFATHGPYEATRNITDSERVWGTEISIVHEGEYNLKHLFFGSAKYPRKKNDSSGCFVTKNMMPRPSKTTSFYRVQETPPLPVSATKLIGGSMQMPGRQKRSRWHGMISQNFSKICLLPFLKA